MIVLALDICLSTRKSLSLQSVSESVVQEIQKILLVHPMLVLTTKAASLQDKYTTREVRLVSLHFFCPKQININLVLHFFNRIRVQMN